MLLSEHGGGTGVRDKDLLTSALARPKQKFSYDTDATLFDLAAAYSFGIAKNHPFVDGNKRTAFTIGTLFLELNGLTLNATEVEATWISALPCSIADCSGHGTCVNEDGLPTCVCDAGYAVSASPTVKARAPVDVSSLIV